MLIAPLLSAAQDASVDSLKQAVVAAANSGDDAKLTDAFEALADPDLNDAQEYAFELLLHGAGHQRPVAVRQLVEHAGALVLADVAHRLRPNDYPDERRQIVRAIGTHSGPEVLPVLAGFLHDPDVLVRAAAASAIADQGDVSAVRLLINPVPSFSEYTEVDAFGDDRIYALNVLGAIRELTGFNAANSREILNWWRRNGGAPAAPAAAIDPPGPPFRSRVTTQSYAMLFDPPQAQLIFAQRLHLAGDDDWKGLEADMETAASDDRKAAGAIFGILHPPICGFKFATHQNIASMGGVSEGYGGFTLGCLTIANTETATPLNWPMLVRHEYVHVLHNTQFNDLPRWLAEGLAVSISESPERTVWTRSHAVNAGLADILQRGGVSAIIGWNGPAGSAAAETASYYLSGLLMDYFRFAGYSAADQRIFAMMGQISRGAPPARALPLVYGLSMGQLDADLLRWVRALPDDTGEEMIRPRNQ